ncbi:putative domain KxDL [Macleaya cordata]|uniref:Putative domain KxDL n=1 Tax=Macleaya cordata TaxID=56857 RepID=A0A200QRI9_MACCD|nr:putative domain KxDL [Macleaya cordata]
MEDQDERESIKVASEGVSRQFKTLINNDDLDSLKQLQHLILGRLQDSNAILSHFNDYSERCFAEVSGDFSRNTRLLKSMKTDLDYIFQKLRRIVVVSDVIEGHCYLPVCHDNWRKADIFCVTTQDLLSHK